MLAPADIFRGKILIVDDQPANVLLLQQTLRSTGYVSVDSTTNPHEVSELHRKNSYDLILLDLGMPGMNGFQVMESLKTVETSDYLPVLVLSAQPEHKLRALKAGARDFISEPFVIAEVLIRVHNMLEVRLLHRETRQLFEHLQTANAALESFSYSVSHDLRAPLRHVLGFVELLARDAGPTASVKSQGYMKTIARSATQMGKLIDDLLAFSRCGHTAMNWTEVDLNELTQETMDEFRATTPGRSITWRALPLPAVRADRALLRMVLVNLVSNALKFTAVRAQAEIEIGCSGQDGAESVIYVRDNGVGFNPAYTEKLFNVFQRLHPPDQFEGTGIGLANVQRIVRRHGGRTWAEGVVDKGATFFFSLPRNKAHQPAPATAPLPPAFAPLRTLQAGEPSS